MSNKFTKHPRTVQAAQSRDELIAICDDLYDKLAAYDSEYANRILDRYNASKNDSDPEGFFSTMSDQDIQNAIQAFNKELNKYGPRNHPGDTVVLTSPMFDLVEFHAVGRNNIPYSGMEVISKGLAKKWVVEIRLNSTVSPDFFSDIEDIPEDNSYQYNGCYVNYGLRMRVDTHIEEFIEVLQAAKEFKDRIDSTYNFKTHYLSR